ncbi:unnamed protein product [Closterium sp. NIES-53]
MAGAASSRQRNLVVAAALGVFTLGTLSLPLLLRRFHSEPLVEREGALSPQAGQQEAPRSDALSRSQVSLPSVCLVLVYQLGSIIASEPSPPQPPLRPPSCPLLPLYIPHTTSLLVAHPTSSIIASSHAAPLPCLPLSPRQQAPPPQPPQCPP